MRGRNGERETDKQGESERETEREGRQPRLTVNSLKLLPRFLIFGHIVVVTHF